MTKVRMTRIDPLTGEDIDSSPEEQEEALREIRDIIRKGDIVFDPRAIADLERLGLTKEVIEAWFFDKKD